MSLTVTQIYAVRFGAKLSLPKSVQDNIAKLRITPVVYKPFRPPPRHVHPKQQHGVAAENWRIKALSNYVSKLKDKGDPDYFEVFAILNKLSASNMTQLVDETTKLLKKRDEQFRLRVSTLMFDKAISESMFASVIADYAVKLNESFPEISEDLTVQATMFTKLYDINDTLTYPSVSEADFDSKVVKWMKQKDKRRGYAKFLAQLFVRSLIPEVVIVNCVQGVIQELNSLSKQPKSEQTDENTTLYVDFLYETSKILPKSATTLKTLIKDALTTILAVPRPELPSLCMRSRFRLEDTLKCVQ